MATNLLLLLTSTIWGFAFVAQRAGMEHLGPFLFNGIRFALGAISLIPVYALTKSKSIRNSSFSLRKGILAGLFLFGGASLQQMGIQYTTAGKAGFITGLYVVLVPLVGFFLGTSTQKLRWVGAISTAIGLYFLSMTAQFSIEKGDSLVLVSAFFFAGHVLYLSRVSSTQNPVLLSIVQYSVVSLISISIALFTEPLRIDSILSAGLPILYGGVFSVGIAYSLQVVAQRKAHPTHAAILLSMEGLFAALGGIMLLGERLSAREGLGALFMFAGILVSHWTPKGNQSEG